MMYEMLPKGLQIIVLPSPCTLRISLMSEYHQCEVIAYLFKNSFHRRRCSFALVSKPMADSY